jgi:hypothetical protein
LLLGFDEAAEDYLYCSLCGSQDRRTDLKIILFLGVNIWYNFSFIKLNLFPKIHGEVKCPTRPLPISVPMVRV